MESGNSLLLLLQLQAKADAHAHEVLEGGNRQEGEWGERPATTPALMDADLTGARTAAGGGGAATGEV